MKTFSYKKAGLLLRTGLLLIFLGLFSSPSYAFLGLFSCKKKHTLYYPLTSKRIPIRNVVASPDRDHSSDPVIVEAILDGDIHCAKKLIHDGEDVNAYKGTNLFDLPLTTPLIASVEKKEKEIVSLLIENNADPFFEISGRRAIDFAYEHSKEGVFFDPVAEEIYNMLVAYEDSYYN